MRSQNHAREGSPDEGSGFVQQAAHHLFHEKSTAFAVPFAVGTTGLCRIPRGPSAWHRLRLLRTLCSCDMENYTIASKQFFLMSDARTFALPEVFSHRFSAGCRFSPVPPTQKRTGDQRLPFFWWGQQGYAVSQGEPSAWHRLREPSPCPKLFHIVSPRAVGSPVSPPQKNTALAVLFVVGTTGLEPVTSCM